MYRLMIAAMESGSGKTVFTCGLICALKKRGFAVSPYKCGPDYIDPSYLSAAAGEPCRNLDIFLMGESGVRASYEKRADFTVVEGAMGYYDGISYTDEASAYDVARRLGLPVVILARAPRSALTFAAQLRGLTEFRRDNGICGVILTESSERAYRGLAPVIRRECGIELLGYLPKLSEAEFASRHLGLFGAGEYGDLAARFSAIADETEAHVDIKTLIGLAREPGDMCGIDEPEDMLPVGESGEMPGSGEVSRPAVWKPSADEDGVTIAVARDEAFLFYYEDSLDALIRHGAKLIFFSPIHDRHLPGCDGLYLGGGYPELYADELSRNEPMRKSIREAVAGGLPTIAECGGFMYLMDSLGGAGMAGALPGDSYETDRAVRFGYLEIEAGGDSMLFKKGEAIPAHEYHHWEATACGSDLLAKKADGRSWRFGYANSSLYAGFPHLHLGGERDLAGRFCDACSGYGR